MLEYFIVVAIVSFFVSEGLDTFPDSNKRMVKMFNNIVKMTLKEDSLMFLPVAMHFERVITQTIRTIQRKKQEL